MRISANLPPGVTALFFDAARKRRHLEAALAQELEETGYSEVILPILDYLESYEPLLAPSTRAELYRFVDRGGDLLALRSDFTPMLARLLAPRMEALDLPLRLFYRGDVVRYQEERAGRMREFYQLGAELLGEEADQADQEILELFVRLLSASGAGEIQVVLGLAGALDEISEGVAPGRADALALAVSRRRRDVVRQAGPALLDIVELGRPEDPAALGEKTAARLERLDFILDALSESHPNLSFRVDLAEFAEYRVDSGQRLEAEGRDYYDGIVFRAYAGRRGLLVGAGGRYDRLFRRLQASVPAVGFSLGIDRLAAIGEGGRS